MLRDPITCKNDLKASIDYIIKSVKPKHKKRLPHILFQLNIELALEQQEFILTHPGETVENCPGISKKRLHQIIGHVIKNTKPSQYPDECYNEPMLTLIKDFNERTPIHNPTNPNNQKRQQSNRNQNKRHDKTQHPQSA